MTLPRGFPYRTLRGDREIYRIHRRVNCPWWFSEDGSGRFDPVGTGVGACYLAESPLGAWVEVFRTPTTIAESSIRIRALQTVALGADLRLADLTSRRALQFGVTASVGAEASYSESQAFARDAVASGFSGIRYLVRHDPAQQLYGLALFAPAGTAEIERWPVGDITEIPTALIEEARRQFGYTLLPSP